MAPKEALVLAASGIDVAAATARWDALNADLRSRLPKKDGQGKEVDPKAYTEAPEKLARIVKEAVSLEIVDTMIERLKAELTAAIKAGAK